MTAPLDLERLKRVAKAATVGPWQVVRDDHPRHIGGHHIERRIFTTWDHPQSKAPDGVVNGSMAMPPKKGDPWVHLVSIGEDDAVYIAAADPTTILALLAELEAAKERERVLAKHILEDDHKRGCQGREYACTCGYDDEMYRLAGYTPSPPAGEREP